MTEASAPIVSAFQSTLRYSPIVRGIAHFLMLTQTTLQIPFWPWARGRVLLSDHWSSSVAHHLTILFASPKRQNPKKPPSADKLSRSPSKVTGYYVCLVKADSGQTSVNHLTKTFNFEKCIHSTEYYSTDYWSFKAELSTVTYWVNQVTHYSWYEQTVTNKTDVVW